MDRRDSLKALLLGTIGGTALVTMGCKTDPKEDKDILQNEKYYGRTPGEIQWDKKVNDAVYLNEHELETIAVICDVILPASPTAGSATQAGVPEFIDFIVKDIPNHQIPIRGGLMWLDGEAQKRFDDAFISLSSTDKYSIIDDIAYPDRMDKKPEMAPGISFFNLMRDLTLTGYYTTKMGFDDLGYVGNTPNVWDGVSEEVLKKHGFEYDKNWIAKCVNQDERNTIAVWDDDMNLIS